MSKKKLIAIITIIVLLFAAGISVGVFLYGRGETEATDGTQTSDQGQVTDGNQDIQGSLADPTIDPETGDGETRTPDEGTVAGAEDNETIENDNQNANNENANNNENVNNTTNTGNNAGNNAGVTTDTNVDNVGETTISRVEEQERPVSRDFLDWWQPMTVSVKPTEVGVILPQITVQKTATVNDKISNLVYAGQDITYIVAVTNNGETAVENIEITDKIPENTAYVDGSIKDAFVAESEDGKLTTKTVEGAKNSIIKSEDVVIGLKWTVTIPAGKTIFVSFTVNVNVGVTGTIENSAIANGEKSNETQTSIIKTNKSSIIIRNNEEVKTARIGDRITYKITVENTGDVAGTTNITDTVPAGTKFISAQEGAIVSELEDTITWSSITVPKGKTVTREFTVEVTNINGKIRNVAEVEGVPTNEDIIDTAKINVEKEVINPKEVYLLGETVEYKVTVTNEGSKTISEIKLQDKVNNTTDIETAVEVNAEEETIGERELATYTFTLEPEEKAYFKYTYTVTEADIATGEVTNIVTASSPDINPETDTETVTPEELNKELLAEKEVINEKAKYALGETVEYKVTVTNIGNQTITGIKLADKVNGVTDIETAVEVDVEGKTKGKIELATYTFTLAPEEKAYFKYTYTVTEADIALGTVVNVVTATAPDTKPGTDTETVTPEELNKELLAEKEVINEKAKYALGETVEYRVTVTNIGNQTITGIKLADKVNGVTDIETVVEVDVEGTTKGERDLATYTFTLAPEEKAYFKYTYTVTEADIALGTVVNVVTATAPDTKPGTDTETVTPEELNKELLAKKEVINEKAKYALGETVEYKVTVTNIGNQTITGIKLADKVNGVTDIETAVEVDVEGKTKGKIELATYTFTLAPEEKAYFKYTYTVTEADIALGTVVNVVTATAPDTKPGTDTETVTPEELNKELLAEKEVINEKAKYALGETVEYRVTVTNIGNQTITGIKLADKVNGVTDIETAVEVDVEGTTKGERDLATYTFTLAPEEKAYFKYTYTVTEADIALGTVVNVVTATAPDTKPGTDTETVTPEELNKELLAEKEVINEKAKYALREKVEYRVTVTNIGNQTITGIKLADKVNGVTDITTAVEVDVEGTTKGEIELATYTFTLAPEEKVYFKYIYTVTEADIALGTVVNVVTATAPDTKPGTDTEEVDTVDTIPLTKVTLDKNVVEEKDKEFRPIASDKVYTIGDNVWYSISVTNNHLAPGSITVTDILPVGMTYVGSTEKIQDAWAVNVGKYDAEKHTLTWEISNLAPGETKTIYINTRITEQAIEGIAPTTSETETLRTKLYEIKNIVVAQQKRDEVEITVKEEIELTSVSVTKTWVDSTSTHDSVTVQLYKDEIAVGQPIELSEGNWSHTWSKLIKKDGETDIVYTVKETKVGTENVVNNETSKYVSTQTSNGNTITITNTRKPEIVATKSATTKDVNGKDVTCTAPMTAENTVPVQIGDTIKYKIIVQNIGGLVAEDVKVQDTNPTHTLPENGTSLKVNVAFNEGTSTPLTDEEVNKFKAGTYTIDIPAFTTATFTFTVKVSEGNPTEKIENTAYVDGKSVGPTIHSIEKIVKVTKYKNNVASSNIVLVLDVSSSMKKNKDGDDTTRIQDAKSAIVQFINDTYAIKENENVTFTLVTFADRNYTDRLGDDANGVGGIFEFNSNGDYIATKAKQEEFISAVNAIATDSGTNMRAGLEVAEKVLYGYSDANGNAVKGIAEMKAYKNYEKLVIFFGDGNPSGDDSLNTAEGIKQKADDIRNDRKDSKGTTIKGAKIFSIGFGTHISNTDSKGYKILSSISNDGKVYTSTTSSGLVQNFATIIGSDPEYSQYTIDGKAIIEITLDSQEITVSEKYPITIKVDGVETPIITSGSNNVTFTTKKITWDVSSLKNAQKLEISYYVQ